MLFDSWVYARKQTAENIGTIFTLLQHENLNYIQVKIILLVNNSRDFEINELASQEYSHCPSFSFIHVFMQIKFKYFSLCQFLVSVKWPWIKINHTVI